MKYFILSFDDNTTHDRRVVELLNQYRLKGTFYINSGNLDKIGFLDREELKTLFQGHEVASHTLSHPRLKLLKKEEVVYQIENDIKNLKSFSGQDVIGFAYPNGEYTKNILKWVTEETDILYARTVKSTKSFDAPENFYEWHPTMHFSGMAYDTNEEEKREEGIRFMLRTVDDFLDDPNDGMLHIWMHSWEFKDDKHKWDQLERLFRLVSQEDEIVSITARDYYYKKSGISK